MSSQDITLMLHPVISSSRDLVLAALKHFYNFSLIKVDEVTI